MTQREELLRTLTTAGLVEELFDLLADVVFFVKDVECRYLAVNSALVRRLGGRRREDLLGRTARDLFPAPLGDRYFEQDRSVCRNGRPIQELLELHLYPDGSEGWCVTDKRPLRTAAGTIIGLAGLSRDVPREAADDPSLADLSEAVRRIHEEFDRALRVDDLAATAQLSTYRFNRRIKALFGLTPAQMLIKTRIDASRRMLADTRASVAEIALACGYCDQSAFTRQFKRVVGLTPLQYRDRNR